MKNVLIICIHGLTSGVLAGKLTEIARKQGEEYVFRASGISDAQQHFEWADYVIVTPQVRDRMAHISEAGKKYDFRPLVLMNTMISFQHAEETYRNIMQAIAPGKTRPDRKALLHTVLPGLLLICLIGGAAAMLFRMTGDPVLHDLYNYTFGMISFYCSLALGYAVFAFNQENTLYGLNASVLIMFCLTPFQMAGYETMDSIRLAKLHVSAECWSFMHLPYYLLMEFVFLSLCVWLTKRASELRMKNNVVPDRNHFLFTVFPMSLLMLVLLGTRAALSFFL